MSSKTTTDVVPVDAPVTEDVADEPTEVNVTVDNSTEDVAAHLAYLESWLAQVNTGSLGVHYVPWADVVAAQEANTGE